MLRSKEMIMPPLRGSCPLSIEQLERGLLLLDQTSTEGDAFREENITAFRQTVLVAIRETCDALLQPDVPGRWRAELEMQVRALRRYAAMADRHISEQARRVRLN